MFSLIEAAHGLVAVTAEEIVAEIFPSLPLDRARRILSFAHHSANAPRLA
jgi:hypothetical protein